MRCYEITLNNGTNIQLRLTAAKLEWYLKETQSDQQNPLLGVLDAVAILGKRIKLLTAALQWPKNPNTVKDGAELLDLLLDDGTKPSEISDMILKLACQAGLMEDDELENMMAANAEGTVKFRDAIRDFLAGKPPAAAETPPQAPDGQGGKPYGGSRKVLTELVSRAVDCGADPREAWDYTPGELLELIRGYKAREKAKGYFGYNLAQCIASMILSKRRPEPWQAFPGMIEYEAMTDDQIWGALDAWAEGVDDECEPEG